MDLVNVEDVSSVSVFFLRLSEGELQYLALSAEYILKHMSDEALLDFFTSENTRQFATPKDVREFLEGTYEQLMNYIKLHCRPEFLPQHFRDWTIKTESS